MKGLRSMVLMTLLITAAGILFTGCGYNITVRSGANILLKADAEEFELEKTAVEPIKSIDIRTGLGEVELIEADDYYVEIDYLYWEEKPEYSLEGGKLSFDDSKSFPNSYSINFNLRNKIKVYLPKGAAMDDIDISTASGNVSAEAFVVDDLNVTVSYGDFTMKNTSATKADITLSSGTSKISDVQVTELDFTNSYGNGHFTNINYGDNLLTKDINYDSIVINMSSGDVKINHMNSNSIEISNSYGDITCEDIVAADFDADLSSGNLDLTTVDLKDVNISNSYGNVNLSLIGSETDYSLDLTTSYGGIRVGNKKYEERYESDNGGIRTVNADLSSGDVKVKFE